MARATFGGGIADFVTQSIGGGIVKFAPAALSFWSAKTGGTRYDLLLGGSTVSTISVGTDGQVPQFQGPDGVFVMWADGGGARVQMVAVADAVALATAPTDTTVAAAINTPGGATATALSASIAGAGGAPTINARDYGTLDPTGAADSTTAIQAAINKAGSAGFGQIRVVLPPGTYKGRLSLKSNVWLDLDGVTITHGSGTLASPEGSAATILGNGSSGAPLTNVRITNGTIKGARINYTDVTGVGGNDGLYLYYCPGAVVQNVTFLDNGQDSVTFDQSDGARMVGCTVRRGGDAGIELRSGGNYVIRDNVFDTVRSGVACKPDTHDNVIQGNKIIAFNEAILVHGVRWRIVNNFLSPTSTDGGDGSGFNAIRFADEWSATLPTGSSSDVLIAGNTFTGYTTKACVDFAPPSGANTTSRVEFTDNHIVGCFRGFQCTATAVTGIRVSGNQMNVSDRGVWAAAGSRWTITDNQITTASNVGIDVTVPDVEVSGNDIVAATVGAIRGANTATGCMVIGNVLSATAGFGVSITGAKASVSGNRVTTSAGAGIIVGAANHGVSNNQIAAAGGEGIQIAAAGANATIVGNVITSATQGVRVGANSCVLTGNQISGATFWGVNISSGVTGSLLGLNIFGANTSGSITDAGTGTVVVPSVNAPASPGLYAATTQTSLANSTTETVVDTYTISGSSAAAGTTYRLEAGGTIDSIATSGTLTLRVRVGGLAGVTVAQFILPSAGTAGLAKAWNLLANVTFRTVGTTGTVAGGGFINATMGASTSAFAATTTPGSNVNTGTDQALVLTAQWATADPGNVFRRETSVVELAKA